MLLFTMSLGVTFFSLIAPKDKIQSKILLFFAWLLLAFNFTNPDYTNYEVQYLHTTIRDLKFSISSEWLFSLLIICSKRIGFSYQQFFAVLGLVYVVMLDLATTRLTKYKNIVLILHFFIILPLSIVQIRSSLGMVIVFWGLTILFDDSIETKKAILYFILLVLVASLIHQASLSFLIIIFARILKKDKCIVVSLIGAGLLYFTTSPLMTLLQQYFASAKFAMWATRGFQTYNYSYAFVYAIVTILLYGACSFIFKIDLEKKCNFGLLDGFQKTVLLLVVFLPMILRKQEWQRIFRLDILIAFVLLTWLLSVKAVFWKKAVGYILIIIALILTFYITAFKSTSGNTTYFNAIYRAVFENNYIETFLE